jgi:hypothetical protein
MKVNNMSLSEKIIELISTFIVFYIVVIIIRAIWPEIASAFDLLFDTNFITLFGLLILLSLLTRRGD